MIYLSLHLPLTPLLTHSLVNAFENMLIQTCNIWGINFFGTKIELPKAKTENIIFYIPDLKLLASKWVKF